MVEKKQIDYIKNIESYIKNEKVICALNKKKVVGVMIISEDNSYDIVMIHPKFIDKNIEEKMIDYIKKI